MSRAARTGLPDRRSSARGPARGCGAPSVVAVLAAAVVLAQVAYPLTPVGTARDRLTVATVLLFAAASVLHAATSRGVRAAVALVVVAGGGGLLAEAVGVATGVPFGRYSYAGTLGPTVLGVPLVIPLAWVMMAWPAYLVGLRLGRGPLARVAIAAVALASWDLFLDPQMVDAGHWHWSDPSPALPGVPTVPLTNYAGWALVALVLMALLDRTVRTGPSTLDGRPVRALPLDVRLVGAGAGRVLRAAGRGAVGRARDGRGGAPAGPVAAPADARAAMTGGAGAGGPRRWSRSARRWPPPAPRTPRSTRSCCAGPTRPPGPDRSGCRCCVPMRDEAARGPGLPGRGAGAGRRDRGARARRRLDRRHRRRSPGPPAPGC